MNDSPPEEPNRVVFTAPLEGERVVIESGMGRLEIYHWDAHRFELVEESRLPLNRHTAIRWLQNWNAFDKEQAMLQLTDTSSNH